MIDDEGKSVELDPRNMHWSVLDPRAGRIVDAEKEAKFYAMQHDYKAGIEEERIRRMLGGTTGEANSEARRRSVSPRTSGAACVR